MVRFFLLISLIPTAALTSFAQNSAPFAIWTDFSPSYNFAERWNIGGDVGYRIEPLSTDQTAYIRPAVTYKQGKIMKFRVGMANFNNFDSDGYGSIEFRTFQFIEVSWPRVIKFQFNHRFGLEQRWFYLPELGLEEYINRARYFLEIKSPNFHLLGLDPPFFMLVNFEILRDINGDNFGRLIDHNRYTIGIGNQINERFRADIRFKLINLVDPLLNTFVGDINVLRFRLFYKISPRASKSMEK